MDSWLTKYLPSPVAAADATATVDPRPAAPAPYTVGASPLGGAFNTLESPKQAALRMLLSPVAWGREARSDMQNGHPVRGAVSVAANLAPAAAELSGPARSLLARILGGGSAEAGDIAAHAPASPGYNWLREGQAQGAVPDGVARHPQMMDAVADSVAGRVAGFIPQGPATALPGADYAQMLQRARRANVGEPLTMPRPVTPAVLPADISGLTRDIDASQFTRTPPPAPVAPALKLTAKEQKYADLLRRQGVRNPEAQAVKDLR